MDGIHILLPMLVTFSTFDGVKDYSDYISRLTQAPRAFEQTIACMRHGMKDGLMPPRFVLDKVADQADAIATQAHRRVVLAHAPMRAHHFLAEFSPGQDDRAGVRGLSGESRRV
jgi:uncharacterized protein (DUF885 family)